MKLKVDEWEWKLLNWALFFLEVAAQMNENAYTWQVSSVIFFHHSQRKRLHYNMACNLTLTSRTLPMLAIMHLQCCMHPPPITNTC